MEIIEIDGVDAAEFARFHALRDDVRRHDQEFPAGLGMTEARVLFTRHDADLRVEGLVAVDGDTWLGMAWLDWWLQENTHLVEVEIAVHPDCRRRGAGSFLLEAAASRAKAAGRTMLSTTILGDFETGESAGTAFAAERGFELKHTEYHQVFELPMADAQLDELEARIAGQHDEYKVLQWREHTPDEWVEQFADALSVMGEEVPVGELDHEPMRWTPERLRQAEERRLEQGRFCHTTAAIAPDGTLAAYTQMGGATGNPERLYQWDTLVRPGHRGRRLGMGVKIPNLRSLQAELDHPAVLHTWNAVSNGPMIAVNKHLGFRPVAQRTNWEKTV